MDTKGFLQAVVPWDTGYVTIHWHRKGRKGLPGRSCQTVDDALQAIADLQGEGVDLYFCLSTQRANSGQRSRDNAERLWALWADLDVDPNDPTKYATLEEALSALLYFCQLVGIPEPSIVVRSGGGLHAYWLSNKTLTVDEWQPFANALKTAGLASSLKFDAGVTGDVVRVLRVPGTNNWKKDEPRPVTIWDRFTNGNRYDFTAAFEPIFKQFPKTRTPPKPKIEVAELFKQIGQQGDLAGGIKDTPLLPFEPIKAGCAWLRNAHETGGRDHKEPEWRQALRCTLYLENGSALAHEFSNQHEEYDVEKTNAKRERADEERKTKNLGWPQCSTISAEGGKPHCDGCPHFPKGKSPLNIGLEAVKSVQINKEVEGLGGSNPPGLRLPEGFVLDEKGRISHFSPGKASSKKVQPAVITHLIKAIVKEPSLKFHNGLLGISFTAVTDRKGTTEVFYTITDSSNMGDLLGSKNVTYNNDPRAMKMLNQFGMSWIDKLRQEDEAIRDSGTMGWRYHDSEITAFVYGDVLYMEDGNERQLLSSTDDDFRKWYTPTGSKDAWLRAAKLLTDRKRPELDCIIAIAFAAPLTAFAGALYGVILSVWGDPGSSKSTAQQVASAVWGHPKQTRESLNSTQKSIQGRLGRTRNLPAYWDDIQDERHQNSLFDCMFVTAEGTEGGRLNTDASMKVRLEWQTLLVACANASFVEFLIKKQKSTTAGMRRVFEFECNKKPNEPGIINAHDASQIFGHLEHNYGKIGAEYAKMLGTEHKDIRVLVSETMKGFMEEVGGTSDENFWWGVCGTLLVGAMLANRLGAELDVPAMRKFLVEAYLNNRRIRSQEGTEGGTYENTEQALTAFLNHYVGKRNVLFTKRLFEHREIKIGIVYTPMEGHPLYVQVGVNQRVIAVSKRALREFLQEREIHTRQIFTGLIRYFDAKETKRTLGAGTAFSQTQEACYEIPIPIDGHPLYEVLVAHGPPEKPTS